ncbi:MAG: type I-E CRISPR-associated protein Cas6/Cse3/CasE [marine bacterium B5-7]|nr:MAG: type I-E CRISPR-associated protein Cas6/Cse3/CasE [marine bacterium B5-7]
MYFSRIRPQPDTAYHTLSGLGGYREHQILWKLFETAPEAKRDFLYRREDHEGWPVFYLISKRAPTASPDQWHIDTKEYKPVLHNGQKLEFSLRVNPVITRKDASGKSSRSDLVMDIKKQTGWQQQPPNERPSMPEIIEQAGRQWLEQRFEDHGAQLCTIRAEGYRQHRLHRPGKTPPIRFSSLDLHGTLSIIDPEQFRKILFEGIGPAKAFGCGLLLVRRV